MYKVHKELLGKFSKKPIANHKKKLWKNISSKVNAVGKESRQTRQVHKHWYDLSKDIKKRKLAAEEHLN